MKTKLLALTFMGFVLSGVMTYTIKAQMVVQDPTANLTATQSLAVTTESLAQAKKEYDLMESTIAKLRKVSTKVSELNQLEYAVKNQAYTIQYSKTFFNNLKNTKQFSTNELAMILSNFNNILEASNNTMKLARTTLTDGALEMNDKERIQTLDQTSKSIVSNRVALDNLNYKYTSIANSRAMYKFMGKGKSM